MISGKFVGHFFTNDTLLAYGGAESDLHGFRKLRGLDRGRAITPPRCTSPALGTTRPFSLSSLSPLSVRIASPRRPHTHTPDLRRDALLVPVNVNMGLVDNMLSGARHWANNASPTVSHVIAFNCARAVLGSENMLLHLDVARC